MRGLTSGKRHREGVGGNVRAWAVRLVLVGLVACGLSSCGGGGGGSRPVADVDVAILFPRVGQLSPGRVLVRGRAQLPTAGLSSVRVNGVEATTQDGFAHWMAEVWLEAGRRELVVDVTDGDARTARGVAVCGVQVSHFPRLLEGAILLTSGEVAFLAPEPGAAEGGVVPHAVFALDVSAGIVRKVASARGGNLSPRSAAALAELPGGDLAVLSRLQDGARRFVLERLDVAAGFRTLLSGAGRGSGPPLELPFLSSGVDLVVARPGTLVAQLGRHDLVRIDVGTGDRSPFHVAPPGQDILPETLVAGADGTVSYLSPQAGLVAVDPSGVGSAQLATSVHLGSMVRESATSLLASGAALQRLDLAAGTVTTLATPEPIGPLIGVTADRLWYRAASGIRTLEPGSGAVATAFGVAIGTGPPMPRASGAAPLPDGRVAFLSGSDVLALDPATGARSILSAHVAAAPADANLVWDGRHLYAGAPFFGLTRIDPADGHRTFVAFPFPVWTSCAEPAGTLLVLESDQFFDSSLHRFDPVGNTLSLVYASTTGTGPLLPGLLTRELGVEAPGRLLVYGIENLTRLDLGTGERELLSQLPVQSLGLPVVGEGPALGMHFQSGQLALVGMRTLIGVDSTILEVDLGTGDRTLVLDLAAAGPLEGLDPVVEEMVPADDDQLLLFLSGVAPGAGDPMVVVRLDLPTLQMQIIAR